MAAEPCSLTLLTTVIAKKIIDSILSDIYEYIKLDIRIKNKKNNILKNSSELEKQIRDLRKVKTLWQVEKHVDIKSFYCDSHVVENKKRKIIKSVKEFTSGNYILIEGIAGQGKSIFLRYLCIDSIYTLNVIPIFIELRKIEKNETLFSHISKFLDVLEMDIEKSLFIELAKSGKFILFLDAFDEVADDIINNIIKDIEYLIKVCSKMKIIITSRPNSGIEMVPQLAVVLLDNYRNDEYKKVVNKLSESDFYSNQLISKIEKNEADIKKLLCTPLMVTLLVISYKIFQEIPGQLSDFYDSLFIVLLQRHDGAKPGYKRKKSCLLNENQYRKIFDNLCFESKKIKRGYYYSGEMYSLVEKSLSNCSIDEDPQNFINDIVKITCLLLEEGGEYIFIHKSVQEYYTSSYIKSKPDMASEKFYSTFVKKGFYNTWSQELRFLSEIDRYRYNKYFLIPYCEIILNKNYIDKDLNICNIDEYLKYIFHDLKITATLHEVNTCKVRSIKISTYTYFAEPDDKLFSYFRLNLPHETINEIIRRDKDYSFVENIESSTAFNQISIYIDDVIKYNINKDSLVKYALDNIHKTSSVMKEAIKYNKSEEFIDLDEVYELLK